MSDIVISSYETIIPSAPTNAGTVSTLLEDVRRLLYTNSRDQLDKLATAVAEDAIVIPLRYGVNTVQTGSLLSIDLEEMYVWDVSGKNVTVQRAQFGTGSTAHAEGALIYINPRFPNYHIFQAINNTVRAMSGEGLYRMMAVDIVWSPGTTGYNLPVTVDPSSIYAIRRKADSAGANSDSWPVVHNWSLERNMDTGEFASGYALFVNDAAVSGNPLRVFFKAPFNTFSSTTDNVLNVSGIPVLMHDVISLGAAIRLAAPREIRRNFDEGQGDTRRANEVPPGANLNAYAGLAVQYRQRILQEMTRLSRQYPDRKPRLWDVGPTTRRRFG